MNPKIKTNYTTTPARVGANTQTMPGILTKANASAPNVPNVVDDRKDNEDYRRLEAGVDIHDRIPNSYRGFNSDFEYNDRIGMVRKI